MSESTLSLISPRPTVGARGHRPTPRLTWRLIRDGPQRGFRNMALDHALACCLEAGEGVVRLYAWSRPTVSFGRNEVAPLDGRADARSGGSLDCVRRPTGGRTVLHNRELTYAVVAPRSTWGGLKAAYSAINGALAHALRRLGVPAEVAAAAGNDGSDAGFHGRVGTLDTGPCFRSLAPGELAVGGRKLVGSAQARIGAALLQHGSILLDDDQAMLNRLSAGGPVGRRPTSLRELVGDVSIDELAETVAKSLRSEFAGRWTNEGYRTEELDTAEQLAEVRYTRDSWTWRR